MSSTPKTLWMTPLPDVNSEVSCTFDRFETSHTRTWPPIVSSAVTTWLPETVGHAACVAAPE